MLIPTGPSHGRAVGRHVRDLQERGRTVVYVAADRPYRSVLEALKELGVDCQSMQFIDVVSATSGNAPTDRIANALFLASPTMLEMLAMRIEQVVVRSGPNCHVLVDSLNTLALYNGESLVQEFSHYLANRLRERRTPGDFVVRDGRESASLQSKVATFTDALLEISNRDAP